MRVAIALGANDGDLLLQLKTARDMLLPFHRGDKESFLQSPIYRTKPQLCPEGAPDFYNAVLEFTWGSTTKKLLELTRAIEFFMGRKKSELRNDKRIIDLDILYADDETEEDPDLVLPHPRLVMREFVLYPLAQIAPHKIIPGTGKSVQELLDQLSHGQPSIHELVAQEW